MLSIQPIYSGETAVVKKEDNPKKTVWEGDDYLIIKIMKMIANFFKTLYYKITFSEPDSAKKSEKKFEPAVIVQAPPSPSKIDKIAPSDGRSARFLRSLTERCQPLTNLLSKAKEVVYSSGLSATNYIRNQPARFAPLAVPAAWLLPYGDIVPSYLFPLAAFAPVARDLYTEFQSQEGNYKEKVSNTLGNLVKQRDFQLSAGLFASSFLPLFMGRNAVSASLPQRTEINPVSLSQVPEVKKVAIEVADNATALAKRVDTIKEKIPAKDYFKWEVSGPLFLAALILL